MRFEEWSGEETEREEFIAEVAEDTEVRRDRSSEKRKTGREMRGLVWQGVVGVLLAEGLGELEDAGEGFGGEAGIGAGALEGVDDVFGGDVADEVVAGEGAATESGERGIEAAAAGGVGGEDFGFGGFGARVEMDAEIDAGDVVRDGGEDVADEFG